jgi:hypothetical protein
MSTENFQSELRRRTLWAMLSHAFFRVESAIVIAMTILLFFLFQTPFDWWPWWGWLALGAVAEILIVWTSLSDIQTGAQVVSEMLRQEFNPAELHTEKYRQRVERALEYRQRIDEAIRANAQTVLREHLRSVAEGIADWIANIFRLAKRLDAYERDSLIKQDRYSVQRDIQELKSRLASEDDEAVKQQLQDTIAQKEAQRQTLEKLQNTMERAEYQLEATLTALGTVYSQMQLIGAKDVEGGRAQRLREDIAEQVKSLQDIVGAMDEVYRGA